MEKLVSLHGFTNASDFSRENRIWSVSGATAETLEITQVLPIRSFM